MIKSQHCSIFLTKECVLSDWVQVMGKLQYVIKRSDNSSKCQKSSLKAYHQTYLGVRLTSPISTPSILGFTGPLSTTCTLSSIFSMLISGTCKSLCDLYLDFFSSSFNDIQQQMTRRRRRRRMMNPTTVMMMMTKVVKMVTSEQVIPL